MRLNALPQFYSKGEYNFLLCYDLERRMYYSFIFDKDGEVEGWTNLRTVPQDARDDALEFIRVTNREKEGA